MPRFTLPLAGAALAALTLTLAAQTGLPRDLGAHPFWATQILWIGAPVGITLAALAGLLGRARLALIAGLLTTLATYGIATYGRTAFAASYAEDQLAGQFWYFGFIACAASAALTLTALPAALAHWRARAAIHS